MGSPKAAEKGPHRVIVDEDRVSSEFGRPIGGEFGPDKESYGDEGSPCVQFHKSQVQTGLLEVWNGCW